ncbi:OmpA family protein [Cellulomonas sp. zg-ZUI22]|uniref:OmpA family protein n=1 Tax=Cellulomonas sp. zg-ZUI22 TaxID=2816955 RepID=UPI001A94F32D|nr:OmpA family protein [Cellulomonas sp. zg-ZUI22]MBO0899740.1 OmpA family protein [Cellulomonas sp. zg-ZUI22]
MSSVRRRASRSARVVAVVAGAVLVASSAAAAPAASSPAPDGEDVRVEGVDVPVRGTFTARTSGEGTGPLVRGAVHGVRRVDGGTVLYLSLGTTASSGAYLHMSSIFRPGTGAYDFDAISQLVLVDRTGGKAYLPLVAQDATSVFDDVKAEAGELPVIYAVFPELPAGTGTVDVLVGDQRAAVLAVPVEEGLLEPVADEPGPRAGTGWPAVPDVAGLGADPARSTFDLVTRTATAATQTAETSERVATTLDANVLFDKSSAALTPAAQEVLAQVAADIAARATGEVQVVGHTDSDGSTSSNDALSQERAAAVVAALQPAAGGRVTFTAVGRGENEPVAPNDSPENMQLNRRVEVVYEIEEGS